MTLPDRYTHTHRKSSARLKHTIHIKTRGERQRLILSISAAWWGTANMSVWSALSQNSAWSIWHRSRAHTYKYCMRQYLGQVSSSYVPDGVSPSCLLSVSCNTHGYFCATTSLLKAVSMNLYMSASILACLRAERWCSFSKNSKNIAKNRLYLNKNR